MTRDQAWRHYFTTRDPEPLVKAYWSSVANISWQYSYRQEKDDMFQVGMIGLLNALDRLDVRRVKSLDAWVYLNVRSAMRNARMFPATESFDELDELNLFSTRSLIRELDVKHALTASSVEEAREWLVGYEPATVSSAQVTDRYGRSKISIRDAARSLGISRRQAYKLLDKVPASW
jgi:hypothetical protein